MSFLTPIIFRDLPNQSLTLFESKQGKSEFKQVESFNTESFLEKLTNIPYHYPIQKTTIDISPDKIDELLKKLDICITKDIYNNYEFNGTLKPNDSEEIKWDPISYWIKFFKSNNNDNIIVIEFNRLEGDCFKWWDFYKKLKEELK